MCVCTCVCACLHCIRRHTASQSPVRLHMRTEPRGRSSSCSVWTARSPLRRQGAVPVCDKAPSAGAPPTVWLNRKWRRGGEASLELAQVVVERLHVGEDAHGVRLPAHDHHVLHLDEPVAAGLRSAERSEVRGQRSSFSGCFSAHVSNIRLNRTDTSFFVAPWRLERHVITFSERYWRNIYIYIHIWFFMCVLAYRPFYFFNLIVFKILKPAVQNVKYLYLFMIFKKWLE